MPDVQKLRRAACALFLITLTTAVGVRADPLVVTDGGLSFQFNDTAGFDLRGDGFSIIGISPNFGVTSVFKCNFPSSCPPGTTIDLTSVFGGELGQFRLGDGRATLNGTVFQPIELRGTLAFKAPTVVVTANPTGVVQLVDHFTFWGRVTGLAPQTADALFDVVLHGNGRVFLNIGGFAPPPPNPYHFLSMAYSFEPAQPVPEPSTVLLLTNGVVALFVGRRFLLRKRT